MARPCQVYDGVALPVDVDGIERDIVVNTEKIELGQNIGEFYPKEELSSMGIYDHSEEELSDLWPNACIEDDEADESSEYGGADAEEYVTDDAHDDDYTWVEVDEGVFKRVSVHEQSPSHDQEEEPGVISTTVFFIDDFSDYDVEDEDEEKCLDIEEMEDRDWTIASNELVHHAQGRPSDLSVDDLLSLPFDAALARLPSLRAHIEESSLADESMEAMMDNFRTHWSRDAPEDLWKVLEEIIGESFGSVPNVEINDASDEEDDKHARTSSIGLEYNVDWAKL